MKVTSKHPSPHLQPSGGGAPLGRLGLLDSASSFITSWYFETRGLSLLHMDGQIVCRRQNHRKIQGPYNDSAQLWLGHCPPPVGFTHGARCEDRAAAAGPHPDGLSQRERRMMEPACLEGCPPLSVLLVHVPSASRLWREARARTLRQDPSGQALMSRFLLT